MVENGNYEEVIGYSLNEKKTIGLTCEKCSTQNHEGFFCRCEMRNIEIAKLLRESEKSPWKNRVN